MRIISLLTLFCFCCSFVTFGQESVNFETWNTNSESLPPFLWKSPYTWSTSNNLTEFILHSVIQSEDSHEGQYAALLRSSKIFGQLRPGILYFGNAVYNFASLRLIPRGGKAMQSQRMRISGWYKYVSDNPGNHGLSKVNIVRIDPTKGDTILIAQFESKLPPTADYTEFEYFINAGYDFNPATDKFQLLFYSNAPEDISQNAELWIDDLNISTAIVANVGTDTSFCLTPGSVFNPFSLGKTPVANGGFEPYIYSWSTNYYSNGQYYTAKDFLDDTTSANPILLNHPDSTITFYLTVTDSQGNTVEDSTKISFSTWNVSADYKSCQLRPGDHCQLFSGANGGISPYIYLWSPSEGLSDASALKPLASPDTTTNYTLLITDAVGCQIRDTFDVFVSPTSVNEGEKVKARTSVFPNPLVDKSLLTVFFPEKAQFNIVIYNSLGQAVKQLNDFEGSFILERNDFTVGLHFYEITIAGQRIGEGRFLVL